MARSLEVDDGEFWVKVVDEDRFNIDHEGSYFFAPSTRVVGLKI